MELVKLTPSKLGGYVSCPACFYREYHSLSPPTFPLPGVLSRMDAILKTYYDSYRGSLPPSLEGKVSGKLVDEKTALTIRSYMKYVDNSVELRGKMDDCLSDSGLIIPLDNKTASATNEKMLPIYQMQLDAYTFLLQQQGFKTADYGYLVYYTPTSGDPVSGVVFTSTVKKLKMDASRIPSVLNSAATMLRKEKEPKGTDGCKMCEWMKGK